jgi:hypothetical protein
MARYSKAIAALLVGIATAGALLPTDAPPWLLAVGVIVQTVAVWRAPANKPAAFPPAG